MNNKASAARTISLLGVMAAVMVVVLFVESAIFKIFSYTPPAFLSLGILMTLCLSWDLKRAFLFSAVFGVTSLLCALFIGNPYFVMPWISILPRLFVGPCAYGVYKLTKKLTGKSEKKFVNTSLPYAIGAAAGIFTNTLLVIACLSLVFPRRRGRRFFRCRLDQNVYHDQLSHRTVCATILTAHSRRSR